MTISSQFKSLEPLATTERAGAMIDGDLARAGITEVDACAYLFRACRDLERTYRDRGIDWLFDVEPAKLPTTVAHTIALMVRAVIDDVIEGASSRPNGGSVAITLQRRGTAYAAVIADRGLRDYGRQSDRDLASVRRLAARLGGDCRIRATSDCRLVIVVFEPNAASAPRLTKFGSADAAAYVQAI